MPVDQATATPFLGVAGLGKLPNRPGGNQDEMKTNMKTTQHTPGPWFPDIMPYDGKICIDHWGEEEAICIAQVLKNVRGDEADANAHLIAAAPEMLATLEGILWDLADESFADIQTMRETIQAAIAKAKGEA